MELVDAACVSPDPRRCFPVLTPIPLLRQSFARAVYIASAPRRRTAPAVVMAWRDDVHPEARHRPTADPRPLSREPLVMPHSGPCLCAGWNGSVGWKPDLRHFGV